MERLRNQICLLGENTKTASHTRTDTCSQQCRPAAFRALCSQITDFLHIMNSQTHRLPQTHIIAQTHCSLTYNSLGGGMGSSSPDFLWFQIFTVSVTFSETRSPSKNSKSQPDILCARLFYANRSECWSSETFHVMSYNLTTSCCSAEGREDGRLWGWRKGREGGEKGGNSKCRARRITASESNGYIDLLSLTKCQNLTWQFLVKSNFVLIFCILSLNYDREGIKQEEEWSYVDSFRCKNAYFSRFPLKNWHFMCLFVTKCIKGSFSILFWIRHKWICENTWIYIYF